MSIILSGDNGITFPNSTTQASSGVVLQVVNATTSTEISSATTTPIDTGLTATITPKFATSKILILVNHAGVGKVNNTSITIRLQRNGSNIMTIGTNMGYTANGDSSYIGSAGNTSYLDSPATTSATTYKTQFYSTANTASAFVQESNATSTITLMEIAG